MFGSKRHIAKRTPAGGINREEYIGLLADEYYETTNVEAQEQVTANLANFAYDPLNYEYLKKHQILNLFFELIQSPNERLILHGIAGICNFCLDKSIQAEILSNENSLSAISKLLQLNNTEIVLNAILTLTFLMSDGEEQFPEIGQLICSIKNCECIQRHSQSDVEYLSKMANMFLMEYCSTERCVQVTYDGDENHDNYASCSGLK